MNVFNRFFLWLLLRPSAFYRKMGVDTRVLRAILEVKLLMDDRRAPAIGQHRKRKNAEPKYATLGTMLFTTLLGAFYLFAFYVGKDYATKLTIYFSVYIFMLASVLITDFTTVLIDVRDNLIILPKPVNDRTFLLSRLLHIVIHVSKMILPMALPAFIYIAVVHGIAGWAPFLLLVVAATLFTIFLINALYVVILKVTTPEKFKNIIGYFQIFFAIFVYGSYQVVPRLVNKAALTGYSITESGWAWLMPPYWFAAAWQYLREGNWGSPLFVYVLVSVLLPLFSVWTVIRYFAPSFNQKLSMISGSEQQPAASAKPQRSRGGAYPQFFGKLVTRKGLERMSFLQAWRITSRSREFKMRVYPSLGYMFIYVLVIFLRSKKMTFETLRTDPSVGKMFFFFLIYFSSYALIMAIYQLLYSDKYKAAWVYYITPIQTPGQLISGAYKAAMVKFFLAPAALFGVVCIWVLGIHNLPNIVLGICNQLFSTGLIAYISLTDLPFSLPMATNVRKGTFFRGLLSLLLPAALGFAHYLLFDYVVAVLALLFISAAGTWLILDSLRNKTWQKIILREYEG